MCELIDLVRVVREGLLLLCVWRLSILLCEDLVVVHVGWVLGYCKKDPKINECRSIIEYLNLLELFLMRVFHI